ncbi:DgsA anti-repressor MtfA [Salmonella enterica subsp. enterica serovar Montevideo str. CT_02035278]|nr:DgsA anti-repressor MtfA [Salmonella enterica subsp. enterica serovar Montevideo str. CT_02035278]
MIKWPWKAQEITQNEDWPWNDALAIPLLVNLTAQEQARLIALAERFLQQKRLVALQGFELDSLKSARIALIFAYRSWSSVLSGLMVFMKCSFIPRPLW